MVRMRNMTLVGSLFLYTLVIFGEIKLMDEVSCFYRTVVEYRYTSRGRIFPKDLVKRAKVCTLGQGCCCVPSTLSKS